MAWRHLRRLDSSRQSLPVLRSWGQFLFICPLLPYSQQVNFLPTVVVRLKAAQLLRQFLYLSRECQSTGFIPGVADAAADCGGSAVGCSVRVTASTCQRSRMSHFWAVSTVSCWLAVLRASSNVACPSSTGSLATHCADTFSSIDCSSEGSAACIELVIMLCNWSITSTACSLCCPFSLLFLYDFLGQVHLTTSSAIRPVRISWHPATIHQAGSGRQEQLTWHFVIMCQPTVTASGIVQ